MSIHETHIMPNPSLPFILHLTHHQHAHIDSSNWHENVEILCFFEGSGTVASNEQRFSVQVGDIIVLNTNCIHTISCESEIRYDCLIIDRSFCLANHFDTNEIHFEPYFQDAELFALFQQLEKEWNGENGENYRVQAIRTMVLQIMTLLCRRHSRTESREGADSHLLSCIKQAIGYIHAESHRELSLEELSERVGLSKFYFARKFRDITGYTVIAYINMIRCENAKRMLTETHNSIGEIGKLCGFSNPSYFTKTFLAVTGMLPRDYRKNGYRDSRSASDSNP